ncbi:MAG: tetratricopeptide repeat protein, partial [Methylovulum sp.]|nr:tetratricopeptide repeat protein [Methylovulum sp.]
MKKSFLALGYIFAISGLTGCFPQNEINANADVQALNQLHNTQVALKMMETERDRIIKQKGSSESYYSENCPIHLDFLQQNAQQGQAIAQGLLAGCYFYGQGVDEDKGQAAMWYRKAAEQGNTDAQTNLKAMPYVEAAGQGDAEAQYNLGMMYAGGNGVAKDDVKAVEWYEKAANHGLAKAQYILGVMYAKGEGVRKNETQAVNWYTKAAKQGVVDAQNALKVLRAAYLRNWGDIGSNKRELKCAAQSELLKAAGFLITGNQGMCNYLLQDDPESYFKSPYCLSGNTSSVFQKINNVYKENYPNLFDQEEVANIVKFAFFYQGKLPTFFIRRIHQDCLQPT